jgi:hypothetical protein
MDSEFVNQDLELAAKRTLTHITGSEDSLKPLYLQPDRAFFLAENLRIILKVYMAGEEIFYNIDQVVEQDDREKVWNVWNEIGGLTPSYDVTAMRLMRFTTTSILTIIDMISTHPERVNLGGQQIAITP